ncbi:DUF5076 domain-containing protein [Novosphingobium sp.]|uniref:DUF5076 domain-containing protein n=1 Tax=Novosphingobium sp. TaxID=1874826 RepID=UPI00286E55D1|nr:DUF5076 domain-containing protein [Novosphingobium sp.]
MMAALLKPLGFERRHPGELDINVMGPLPPDAAELARLWVNSDRSFVGVSRSKSWTPELLGALLIECAHTAATTFAANDSLTESEALARILNGMDEERLRLKEAE